MFVSHHTLCPLGMEETTSDEEKDWVVAWVCVSALALCSCAVEKKHLGQGRALAYAS